MPGLNIDPLNPAGNPDLDELVELGVTEVRFSYKDFSAGDEPDPEQVAFYSQQLERFSSAGIGALLVLAYETVPGAPTDSTDVEAWQPYIERFARRAGQLAQIVGPWMPTLQIWNEPDLPPHPEYIRTMTEALYADMLRQSYQAVKDANPRLQVAAAGLGSGNPAWLRTVVNAAGGQLPADFIAIHPYGQRPEPTWPTSTWGFGYVGDLLNSYADVSALPVIISEVGEQQLSQPEQAEYLRRLYTHLGANFTNSVKSVFWFCYSDGMVPPYGLIDAEGQRKPAFYAFSQAVYPPPAIPDSVMQITATVNQADYDNMLRTYWEKDDIDADISVDGALYPKGEIAFRGSSSLNFPKKGFKIKFPKKNLYQGHTRRFDLSASYVDKSLIRERLSFDLFAKTSVVASTAWHVFFTIENRERQILEQGLFTAIEHVDKYFFRNRSRDIGGLYKADGGLVNGVTMGAWLNPQPEAVLKILYDQDEAKKIVAKGVLVGLFRTMFNLPPIETADADEEDYSDLITLINTLASLDPNTVAQHLPEIFDVDSYLDWLAVNALVQSNDTYHKNYFIHNRMEDDRWEIMPWDYDLTWGRNWNDYCDGLCDDLSEGTSIKGPNQMTNRLSRLVLSNPTYYNQLRSKLADLLGSEFTEEKLFPKIDAYYADITPLAHLDSRKWPTNEQFDQERNRLKDWVRRRRRFLLKELGTVSPPQKVADTVVTAVGFNKADLITGNTVTFQAVVQNIGGAVTGDSVGVAFLLDGQYITFGLSSPLEAGSSRQINAVSAWTATEGSHTLTAVVDDINRYPELSEDNNAMQISFRVEPPSADSGLADVLIKDIAFTREEAGRIRLAALVENQGDAATADVVGVAFFVDDKYTTFGVIPPLQAGDAKGVRANQSLSLTGSHKITAIADDVNRFPEEQEQNNTLVKHMDFGATTPPGEPLADTILLGVSLGAGRFTEGDQLTFEASVKNIGAATTSDIVGVAFLVDGQYITFGTTPAMQPDEIRTVRAVSPWRAVTGTHRLLAVVDDINRYPELSESNNTFELAFEVLAGAEFQLPDSTIGQIDFEFDEQNHVLLTATVANIGPGATPDVVGVAFFVDGQYRTFGLTNPMEPGTTETIRAVQALPLEGTHQITAIVDDINRYDEISHHNNGLERTMTFARPRPERRAIWITRFDWTNPPHVPEPETIDRMVANIAQAGFNTIFFQVRGEADAYYTPGLEPWAARLTGSLGNTLGQNPGWDPLARMLEKAHEAGLAVHAYVNVYPVWIPPATEEDGPLWPRPTTPAHLFDRLTYGPDHERNPGEFGLGYTWRQHAAPDKPMSLVRGRYLWASPGVPELREHVLAVVADLTRRYDLDGIHLDRIRYAGPEYSLDPISNEQAGLERTPERAEWQRAQITAFVRQLKTELQAIKPNLEISAAVWPYFEDKWGWGLSEGYHDYFQNSKGWLAEGAVDAIAPMLYGGVSDNFERWQILLNDFLADSGGRAVYAGIGGGYDDFEAIVQRIEAARRAGAAGHVIFSYSALQTLDYWTKLAEGVYAVPAG